MQTPEPIPLAVSRASDGRRTLPLGQQLKHLRQARGLSLQAVSQALKARGVETSSSSLSNWERGNAVPPSDQLAALGAVYNATFTLSAGRIHSLDTATASVVSHMLSFREERREEVADLITTTLSSMLRGLTKSELLGEPTLGEYEVHELLGDTEYDLQADSGALIRYRVDDTFRYPVFQFDLASNCIHPVVANVNKLLDARTDSMGVLAWWIGPNDRVAGQPTPKDLLRRGDQAVVVSLAKAVTTDAG